MLDKYDFSLHGCHVVVFPFPSLKDYVGEVSYLSEVVRAISSMASLGYPLSFVVAICDSFQSRHDYKFLEKWCAVCSPAEDLSYCGGADVPQIVPQMYTFHKSRLEHTSTYVLIHRLALFLAALDNSLKMYDDVYIMATRQPYLSLQACYKISSSKVAEDETKVPSLWYSITAVGDCPLPIMCGTIECDGFIQHWKRLVVGPGHTILLNGKIGFRILCSEAVLTALIAIWIDRRSFPHNTKFSIQQFSKGNLLCDGPLSLDSNVLFTTNVDIPYFTAKTVLFNKHGAFHPVSFEAHPYDRSAPPAVDFLRRGVPSPNHLCPPILCIEDGPEESLEKDAAVEDTPADGQAAPAQNTVTDSKAEVEDEDEIDPVVSKKNGPRISSVADRVKQRKAQGKPSNKDTGEKK